MLNCEEPALFVIVGNTPPVTSRSGSECPRCGAGCAPPHRALPAQPDQLADQPARATRPCSGVRLCPVLDPAVEQAWDVWQAERHRRGEIDQQPAYADNPLSTTLIAPTGVVQQTGCSGGAGGSVVTDTPIPGSETQGARTARPPSPGPGRSSHLGAAQGSLRGRRTRSWCGCPQIMVVPQRYSRRCQCRH
jgi:hypothetical protein